MSMPSSFKTDLHVSETNEKVKCPYCDHEAHMLIVHLMKVHNKTVAQALSDYKNLKLFSRKGYEYYLQETGEKKTVPSPKVKPKKKNGIESGRTELINLKDFGLSDYEFKRFPDDWSHEFEGVKAKDYIPHPIDDYMIREEYFWFIIHALSEFEIAYVHGPTGTGKSTGIFQLASFLNWPLIRVSMDCQITRETLLGSIQLADGETKYRYGLLPMAMKLGAILLLDEFDMISPDLAPIFQSVLERNSVGLGNLTLFTGYGYEVVEPHPDFRIIATGNSDMRGDMTGLYNSVNIQNMALKNRFTLWFNLNYMDHNDEKKFIMNHYNIDEKTADIMVAVSEALRTSFSQGNVSEVFGTRKLFDWARIYKFRDDLMYAFEIVFLNSLTDIDKKTVSDIIAHHYDDYEES